MKKLIIITGILLLAVAVFAQHESKERARHKIQNHKSEAAARQSADRIQKNTTHTTRTDRLERTYSGSTRAGVKRVSTETRTAERSPAAREKGNSVSGHKNMSGPLRTNGRKDPVVEKRKPGNGDVRTGPARSPDSGNGNYGNKHEKPSVSSGRHAEQRRHYATPNRMPVRKTNGAAVHHVPVRFKKVHHYKAPSRVEVIWSHNMYREYRILYPEFRYWYYPAGYRIVTVPAYNAGFHIGEVRNVYGRIHEVWYSWSGDEYHLYFGGTYPYQDFTVILSGRDARRFHRHPELFFEGRYVWVTGLVSTFEGKPEIMVKRRSQVHLY